MRRFEQRWPVQVVESVGEVQLHEHLLRVAVVSGPPLSRGVDRSLGAAGQGDTDLQRGAAVSG